MTDTIGERIRNLRLIRGYTQEELAERLYMRKSTISAYENNAIDIKVTIIFSPNLKKMLIIISLTGEVE